MEGDRLMIISDKFKEYIEETCDIDKFDGKLRCKKCGCKVVVNWFERQLDCIGCDEL